MKKHRFTLMELLMVIAIIAILFSMIFPSFSKARKKAAIVVCMNNQNQINKLKTLYATNNNNIFPLEYGYYPRYGMRYRVNEKSLNMARLRDTGILTEDHAELLYCPDWKDGYFEKIEPKNWAGKFGNRLDSTPGHSYRSYYTSRPIRQVTIGGEQPEGKMRLSKLGNIGAVLTEQLYLTFGKQGADVAMPHDNKITTTYLDGSSSAVTMGSYFRENSAQNFTSDNRVRLAWEYLDNNK